MIVLVKRNSKIQGKGVFTRKKILKGEMFYKIPLKKLSYIPMPNCAYIGEGMSVCDSKVLNWVNHSCKPNAKLDTRGLSLIALRKILPDEEITLSYTETEGVGSRVDCNCKSKNCKGYFVIRSRLF